MFFKVFFSVIFIFTISNVLLIWFNDFFKNLYIFIKIHYLKNKLMMWSGGYFLSRIRISKNVVKLV